MNFTNVLTSIGLASMFVAVKYRSPPIMFYTAAYGTVCQLIYSWTENENINVNTQQETCYLVAIENLRKNYNYKENMGDYSKLAAKAWKDCSEIHPLDSFWPTLTITTILFGTLLFLHKATSSDPSDDILDLDRSHNVGSNANCSKT